MMIEKDLMVADIQKQLRETDDQKVKEMLFELLFNITSGKYAPRIW